MNSHPPGHPTKSTCIACENQSPVWTKNVKLRDKKSGTSECAKICVCLECACLFSLYLCSNKVVCFTLIALFCLCFVRICSMQCIMSYAVTMRFSEQFAVSTIRAMRELSFYSVVQFPFLYFYLKWIYFLGKYEQNSLIFLLAHKNDSSVYTKMKTIEML